MSWIEEYLDEEWAKGYAIGKTGVILELIDDNTISIEKGADFLGISVQEMLQRYSEYKTNR